MKSVKTFFFTFPALNSTAMNKKLKYSISYPIKQDFVRPNYLKNFTIKYQSGKVYRGPITFRRGFFFRDEEVSAH